MNILSKAERIYKAAIAEVEPENLIKKSISIHDNKLIVQDKKYDLDSFDNIYLVSIGKAAPFMAKSILEILGDRVKEGIIICSPQDRITQKKITCIPASHPLPEEASFRAAQNILGLAKRMEERDLLFFLVSGGGSAQVTLPAGGISLEEKKLVTYKLLRAGADIKELNTVRKHLSRIKGGWLARAAFPAEVISLFISDVIHNDLETISSGPTCWDSSTFKDALNILKKHGIWDFMPSSVKDVIEMGIMGQIEETPKKDDPVFKRIENFIIGDNSNALKAARKEAENLGFVSFVLSSSDHGEASKVARNYISLLMNILRSGKTCTFPLCLLSGGELTVSVKRGGKGGRNQEFVLASIIEIDKEKAGLENFLILSIGTDGIDGPTDAAGAWAGPLTMEKARNLSLDPVAYLGDNDSYNFFKKVGGLIITGPTHTNVMDFRLFIIDKLSAASLARPKGKNC